MRFLAINTAGAFVETVAVNGDKVCYRYDTERRKAAEVLLNLTDDALFEAGLQLADVDFVACCKGPGSFTGIRIGVTTARAFAHALGKKTVAFTSLDVLAYNNTNRSIICAADAGNGFIYADVYENGASKYGAACLNKEGFDAFILNNKCEMSICEPFLTGLYPAFTAAKLSADALIAAAVNAYKKDGAFDFSLLEPLYIRQPQAYEVKTP